MSNKDLIIKLSGDEAYLNAGLDGMAYNNGYKDTILDEDKNEIANPETKLTFCTRIISNFMRNNVIAWNTKQAQIQASHTVPSLFGLRDWFERKFGDLCSVHDHAYIYREETQHQADCDLAAGIMGRGYPWLGVATYIFCRLFGWLYWYDWIK